jgi:flavin-dependent dehydrogenase
LNRSVCDVLIVGGGPAGLAAAIALKMRGADVLVADALKPPIDKACGEGLMPDARRDLAALGVGCEAGDGAWFDGIRFEHWTGRKRISASAVFPADKGFGMRRTVLHTRLLERAAELGVRFRWETHVALGRSVTLNHELCTYRYLVGADGQSSQVRKWADLDRGRLISRRFGFRSHYRLTPFSSFVEVHWSALGQVYITPVAPDEICVATVTSRSDTRMQQVIDSIPYLRERFNRSEPSVRERGSVTLTRRLKRVVKDNIALIGDASGSVDAVTGEGLALSFRQAALLGRAIASNNLKDYAAGHGKILQMPQRMARALLLMDKHSALRNVGIRAFSGSPALFRNVLDVHVGEETLPHFLMHHGMKMLRLMASPRICAPDREGVSL